MRLSAKGQPRAGAPTSSRASQADVIDWGSLVAVFVHPTRVAIIEALTRLGEPLSATDLRKVFGGRVLATTISQHVNALAKVGVLEEVDQRRVRGATERFYFFPEASEVPAQEPAGLSIVVTSASPPETATLGYSESPREGSRERLGNETPKSEPFADFR